MAIAMNNLCYVVSAIKDGYIPIIDMKHYTNRYFKDNREYKDNAWEYYFEQPVGCNLGDIDDFSEVIISKAGNDIDGLKSPSAFEIPTELQDYKLPKKLQEYKECFNKYIKFNKDTKLYLEEQYKKIIGDNESGTDYAVRKTVAHPKQPSISQLIKKVKNTLKKYPDIKKIYLATEDLDIYNALKNEFKDLILDNGQERVSYKNKENKYKFLSQVESRA